MSTQTLLPRSQPCRTESPPAATTVHRICHISLGTNVGGMEKLLVEFARFSDRRRFELTFFSLQRRGKLADEIENYGCVVHDFAKREGLQPSLILRMARKLRQLQPQIVHTHNTAAFFYGACAAMCARVPVIVHTRHGQRFSASRRETMFFRWLSRGANQIVSVSDDARRLSWDEGVPSEKTRTIRNGVDLSRFPYVGPQAYGPAILVARLSAEKDVATLVRAMQIVQRHQPQLALNIVGEGDQRLQLERLVESLNLRAPVRFLGERRDIPELLSHASMFVLPSLTEGISLTLLEAMARGLPVIATRVGGTPEVVLDGITGLLVPARAPELLAQAMLQLHGNPPQAAQMGQCGRERVEQCFSIESMVSQYEQLYSQRGV